ncbi:MAG: DUF5688 family protein [Lachnospiraceae bacterium]|nr:DUF5688 family protein [Lachnospiraceae bacterium]
MNYSTFLQQITKEIKERVGASAQVQVSRISKVNLPVAEGMTILLPGENASPTIYLEQYYQKYLEGNSLSVIAEEILTFYQEHRGTCSFDFSFYTDFEKTKDRIVCRLINYDKNRSLLQSVPHRRFLDLAIVYYYQMDNSLFGKSSLLVRTSHLDQWSIDPDLLHAIALRNTRRLLPFRITTLAQLLEDIPEIPLFWSGCGHNAMYILTNEELCFGAINIIFDDILYAVANKLESDFYVLPSSIHECLLLPVTSWEGSEPQRLQEIVSEINKEYVSSEEVLGDHIYRYMRERHDLRLEV